MSDKPHPLAHLSTESRLDLAAARGMGDAVRSHLISLDYALSKGNAEAAKFQWEAARLDFAVLTEALKRMEIG